VVIKTLFIVKKSAQTGNIEKAQSYFERIQPFLYVKFLMKKERVSLLLSLVSAAIAIGDLKYAKMAIDKVGRRSHWSVQFQPMLELAKAQPELESKASFNILTQMVLEQEMSKEMVESLIELAYENRKGLLENQIDRIVKWGKRSNYSNYSDYFDTRGLLIKAYILLNEPKKVGKYLKSWETVFLNFLSKIKGSDRPGIILYKKHIKSFVKFSIDLGYTNSVKTIFETLKKIKSKVNNYFVRELHSFSLYVMAKQLIKKGEIQSALALREEMHSCFQAKTLVRLFDHLYQIS